MSLDLQSAFYAASIVLALIWCIVGWGIVTYLMEIPKPGWAALLLVVLGGPVCWAVCGWRELMNLRERVMARHGVAGYSCCGGRSSCRHNPQREIDRLTNQ